MIKTSLRKTPINTQRIVLCLKILGIECQLWHPQQLLEKEMEGKTPQIKQLSLVSLFQPQKATTTRRMKAYLDRKTIN